MIDDDRIDFERARTNPGEVAALMLRLVDDDPRHAPFIGIPEAAAATDELLDEWERVTIREYSRAEAERPNLAVKIVAPPSRRRPARRL